MTIKKPQFLTGLFQKYFTFMLLYMEVISNDRNSVAAVEIIDSIWGY